MSCHIFSGRFGGPICAAIILLMSALSGGSAAAESGADLQSDLASLNAISHPAYLELEVNRLIARYPERRLEILAQAARLMPAWPEYWRPEYWQAYRQKKDYRTIDTAQAVPVAGSVTGPVTSPVTSSPGNISLVNPWSVTVAVGGNRKSGNTEKRTANVEIEVAHKKARWTNDIDIDFDYSENSRVTTDQSLEVQFDSRYQISSRWFVKGTVEYEDDRFSGLDWRASERIGVGNRLFEWSGGFLDIDAGPGLEQRAIENTGQTETEFLGFVEAGLSWKISPQTLLRNDLSTEISEENTRTENETRLEVTIYRALKAVLSVEIENNSDVAPGVEKTDIETKLLFAYKFGGG